MLRIGILELMDYLDTDTLVSIIEESPKLMDKLVELEEEHIISLHNNVPYLNLTKDLTPKLLYNSREVKLTLNFGLIELHYYPNSSSYLEQQPISSKVALINKLKELYGSETKALVYADKLIEDFMFKW